MCHLAPLLSCCKPANQQTSKGQALSHAPSKEYPHRRAAATVSGCAPDPTCQFPVPEDATARTRTLRSSREHVRQEHFTPSGLPKDAASPSTSIPQSSAFFLNTASAVGERQMFPKHTNMTFGRCAAILREPTSPQPERMTSSTSCRCYSSLGVYSCKRTERSQRSGDRQLWEKFGDSFKKVMAGHIDRIEVQDFKSYAGKQTIGPFKEFSAVIGPNGAGAFAN